MKKIYLLGAIGLVMASCANDDLVVKTEAPTVDAQTAIAFKGRLGNMSRASQLEDVMDNFGVWAIKADADADLDGVDLGSDAKVVMPDYMVGHQTSSSYGSDWSYVMDTPKQYLKYWDGAFAKTYFFAYGPHNSKLGTDKVSLAIADNVATLAYPEYQMGTDADAAYIYAKPQVETNADHIAANAGNTTLNPKKVPIHFNRLFSQLQVAIYEDIPGYHVELEDVTFADGETGHIVAIPAVNDADATDADDIWTRGNIVNSATPSVTFSGTGYQTVGMTYTKATTSDDNIDFALPAITADANGHKFIADGATTGFTAVNNASYSATIYNVVPVTDVTIKDAANADLSGKNAGLQFVVNYKLYSDDTNEVIEVRGARVFVPETYTNWAPNTLYTYIFRITTNSSGTTTTTDPKNDPVEPTPCLYPIIFDDVTIEDLNKQEYEFDITGLVMSQLTAEVAAGADLTLTLTALDANGVAVPVTGATWNSSDENVATVTDGVVHGVAPDTAIITAEYEVRDNRTLVASCVVIVKEATPAPSPKPAR